MIKDFMFSGNFSFMDDYFYFDGYGHVTSCTEKEAAERIRNDKEFVEKLRSDFIEDNYTDDDIELIKDIANIFVKHGY
jgi:hemerythrin superfamily protein